MRLLAIPVKRSDLSNVKHRVRTSSEEIGEVRIAIVTLHSSLPSWAICVGLAASGSGPIYPNNRTYSVSSKGASGHYARRYAKPLAIAALSGRPPFAASDTACTRRVAGDALKANWPPRPWEKNLVL